MGGSVEHVVVCSPGETDLSTLPVILMGINEDKFRPSMKVLTGGSSMGQCVTSLLSVLHTHYGVVECDITMIQANNTNNNTVDGCSGSDDWRLGRAVEQNIIPCSISSTLSDQVIKVRQSRTMVAVLPIEILPDVFVQLLTAHLTANRENYQQINSITKSTYLVYLHLVILST